MWGRWLGIVAFVLLVPIIPFIFFHASIAAWVDNLAKSPPTPVVVVGLVVGLLSTDVFLPVPSSLVSTLAGGQLPAWVATLASWVGLNAGAALGFWTGRAWGRPLAERLCGPQDLQQLQPFVDRYSTGALVLTRALPILAEATVLLLGIQRIDWRRFWPPVLLSNLGLASAYSLLGHYAHEQAWLPLALSVSVALPLLATWCVKRRWARRDAASSG